MPHLMSQLLRAARSEGTAVAAVNFYSFESARGALLAASSVGRPVILAFGARYLKNLSLTQAAALARCCAEGLDVKWALHLDRCADQYGARFCACFPALREGDPVHGSQH